MPDGTGCITFKSGFHMMAKQDLKQYFSQLMITDVPRETRESFATAPHATASTSKAAESTSSQDWHEVTEDPSMAPYLG